MVTPRQSYQDRAKRIADFYIRVDKDRKRVVSHFGDEGIPARTVHRIIRQFEKKGDVAFKKIPGRNKKLSPEQAHEQIAALYKANPRLPTNEVAKKLGVSRSTLFRILNDMQAENKETYKAPAEVAICPTCRQRCDPEVLESAKQRKRLSKERKVKPKIDLTTKVETDVDNNAN